MHDRSMQELDGEQQFRIFLNVLTHIVTSADLVGQL
jgi:hypothetical protein